MKNRIKAHRRVRAGDLVPHELNPRTHSDAQRAALRALYDEIGFARSQLAYELPDGRLKLIDGHLRREHRTVTLPDYQGAGIGNALSAFVASLWKGLGYRALSTTTHPAMIASRRRSSLWQMIRAPSFAAGGDSLAHATSRLTAGFEYVGPMLPPVVGKEFLRTQP
jgi:GNAT superfamily N-acetyltransferase